MKAFVLLLTVLALPLRAFPLIGTPTWTDPKEASEASPDFRIQGEYATSGSGLQVVATGKGTFHALQYPGGLPGLGWDGSAPERWSLETKGVRQLVEGHEAVQRHLPTVGMKPPENAKVLFDGEIVDGRMKGKVIDGLLAAGASTTGTYRDFKLHLEFRVPFKPEAPLSHQDRGNSGVYIFKRYECQILDTFGHDYDLRTWEGKLHSDPKQWGGSLYKFRTPDLPMCLPPLTWQSYDIDFTAPRFAEGKKVANARITVVHNGVTIHDDVELPRGTGKGGKLPEMAEGPIIFQAHANPVQFRNIWIVEK